ncbi:MAG: glycosyl hydrolase family 95 catalytic domain-containing protein, partial [Tannerellaceae bacterium]
WWSDYWNKSYVTIPDKEIEKHYYLSLYGMGSCSRDADFAPSIFGSWITKERPFWNGDYHLNYNHMAPYYALYSANRLEQAMPYTNSILPQIERGKHYSLRVTGIKDGIMLPVGAGPLGIETCRRDTFMENHYSGWIKEEHVQGDGFFMGQKSNSSYAVVNMSMHFYRTWDKAYAQRVYPFVKGVANFWKGYLSKEGDRYVIYNDAIHEGTIGTMNPILSLGLARMVLQTAIDMSEYLDEDTASRENWADLKAKLSDFPLQERDGKTIFRYTEKGVDWWGDNTLGIQHIYPAGQIGLASNPSLLETAHNTIDVMQRWIDFNGSNSFFPAAVRVGYNADTILSKLNRYVNNTYPNGFQRNNPHGIENFSTTPNTINEMLCMGHQDVVRVFPVWPTEQDATFERIRVEGAFLVSGSIKKGQIGPVTITSEQGRPLVLQNPWHGKSVKITSTSGDHIIQEGAQLSVSTHPGETYFFTIN